MASLGRALRSGRGLDPAAALALQRAVGNRTSARILRRQPVLSGVSVVDEPGDGHDREIKVNPGGHKLPNLETQLDFLKMAPERRGAVFDQFLREINMSNADAIVGPLGEGVFTGITAGKPTTQVCIRSQAAADKLNAIMKGH